MQGPTSTSRPQAAPQQPACHRTAPALRNGLAVPVPSRCMPAVRPTTSQRRRRQTCHAAPAAATKELVCMHAMDVEAQHCPEQQADTSAKTSSFPEAGLLLQGSQPGVCWRVRPFRLADKEAVLRLQTDSFHQAMGLPMLDGLAYRMFEAEVRDALQQKLKYNSRDSFVMLVAERALPSSSDDCSSSSSQQQRQPSGQGPGPRGPGEGLQMQEGTSMSGMTLSATAKERERVGAPTGAPGAGTNHGAVVGVVEVTRVSKGEVLMELRRSLGASSVWDDDVDSVCYVSSMAVAASERRRGLASALLTASEGQAMQWRTRHLALYVHQDNDAAVQLYRKYGLRQVWSSPSWMQALGTRTRLLMHKDLLAPSVDT